MIKIEMKLVPNKLSYKVVSNDGSSVGLEARETLEVFEKCHELSDDVSIIRWKRASVYGSVDRLRKAC